MNVTLIIVNLYMYIYVSVVHVYVHLRSILHRSLSRLLSSFAAPAAASPDDDVGGGGGVDGGDGYGAQQHRNHVGLRRRVPPNRHMLLAG